MKQRISLVVAMDRHGLIGTATGLPWQGPADLRRFRQLTMGHPVIVGRKTFEQIGRPLKGRLNIVLTRSTDWQSQPGCVTAHSLEESLKIACDHAASDEVFVIGGADVYRQAMPYIQRVYLTVVEGEFTGNTWFPFDGSFRGATIQDESFLADANNPHPHRFVVVDRAEDGALIQDLLCNPKEST